MTGRLGSQREPPQASIAANILTGNTDNRMGQHSMAVAELPRIGFEITRIHAGGCLASLRGEWNHLAGDVPFRRWEWQEAWWRHYRRDADELFVVTLRQSSGELVGLAPWYRRRTRAGLHELRLLGTGEVASDYVGIFAAPEHELAVADELAQWLTGEADDRWDLIRLEGVSCDDRPTLALADALHRAGRAVERRTAHRAWRLELPASWDDYLARLSKSRRERVRRLGRRALESGRAKLHPVDDAAQLERALDILADLHQRRRQSLGEPGCFASPRFRAFHAEVARRFFDMGRLRMQWLELDGQPAAAEYSLLDDSTIYYYQSGFDPRLARERPGWLALTASLRQAIDQQYAAFDFLRGDEEYKGSLAAEPRSLLEVRIAGARGVARASHAALSAWARFRDWCRQHGLRRPRGAGTKGRRSTAAGIAAEPSECDRISLTTIGEAP